jgi:hypothetical protein
MTDITAMAVILDMLIHHCEIINMSATAIACGIDKPSLKILCIWIDHLQCSSQ